MRSPKFLLAALLAVFACEKDSADSEAKVAGKAAADEGGEKTAEPEPEKPALPEASVLLDKAVEAAGGADAISKVHSYYYEGHLEVQGQRLESLAKVWWKDGDFYTEQEMIGVGMARAGKSGDVVWSEDPMLGLRQLEGIEAEQAGWLADIMLTFMWKRYFAKAETLEEREAGGKSVYVVRLTTESGATVDLHLDAETGLQRALEERLKTPMGEMPVSAQMLDYREVDGVKVAFKQITDMGIAKATLDIQKLEFNPEMSTARFQMPRSDADVVTKPPSQ